MSTTRKPTLSELAKAAGGTVRGPGHLRIAGVNTLADARPDEITWLTDDKYRNSLASSRAGAVLVRPDFGPTPMPAVLCPDPQLGLIRILELLAPPVPAPQPGVDAAARIADTASIGDQCAIGPNVVIGAGVRIGRRCILYPGVFVGDATLLGDDCVLWPGVVVRERSTIGNRVIIHSNAVIGTDGFGYYFAEGRHQRIPQVGTVRIEDDVEIGAGTCIDRAKVGATVIGAGTKIDNLVMVAHNVQIGPRCILAGQVGLSGSVRLGEGVILGGQAGVADHRVLGDGAKAGAQAGIIQDVPAGAAVTGYPARESREYLREQVQLRKLPELINTLRNLAKRVERLEGAADDS